MQRRATRPAPVPSGGRKKKRSGSEESAKSVVEVKEEPVVVTVNEACPTKDETDAAIASLLEECKTVNDLCLSPLDAPLDPGFCKDYSASQPASVLNNNSAVWRPTRASSDTLG